MGTEVTTPMQDFTERLKASLRDDVARMIPDEVLQQMIQSVIREEFFEGKVTKGLHHETRTPPAFHALIVEAIKPTLQAKAAEFAVQFAPQIEAGIQEVIRTSASQIILSTIDRAFADAAQQLSNNWGFQNAVVEALKRSGVLGR